MWCSLSSSNSTQATFARAKRDIWTWVVEILSLSRTLETLSPQTSVGHCGQGLLSWYHHELQGRMAILETYFLLKNAQLPSPVHSAIMSWSKAGHLHAETNQLWPTTTICKTEKDQIWDTMDKVNRCLGRYSPHATTTNQPTNPPKFFKRLISIWEKATFLFEQLFSGRGQNMVRPKKCMFFLAQNLGFWPKNPIFAIRPQFWSMTYL